MLLQKALGLFLYVAGGLARSLPQKLHVRQNPTDQVTTCGDIIEAVDSYEGFTDFWAKDAYECLSSVPFNPAVATRFVKYWNETVQFQSTLAYLKNPPTGYQQPAVDVLSELSKIQQRIDSGFYTNQYAFEADFQLLTYAMHDGHVQLIAGVLAAFTFSAPFEIISVSVDGKSAPKVYFTQDVIESQAQGWTPSPIKTINGEDVIDYLTKFAALNSWGYLEPHAEWNALMSSPVLDIQAGGTIWSAGATFYPGNNLTVHFENYTGSDESTIWDTVWIATYNEAANYTGPLTTGGDFYNYFVLGNLPASFNYSSIVTDPISTQSPAAGNWFNASYEAFPASPDIAQFDLDIYHTGIVSGYFLHDISTGVLSLPSFDVLSETIGNYSDSITDFLTGASAAGLEKIIIDLQRNTGGVTLLAYTTFKQFFPDLMPYAGSRRRSFREGNVMGSAITEFWELLNENDEDEREFKEQLAADEWVITNRINAATGKNFTSWKEYQDGPFENDDKFSQVEQYDLANKIFDEAAFEKWIPVMYMSNRTAWSIQERLFNPDQIVILTDGICSSACSLLIEMMTRVGVKTVVAGGQPQASGPMQAASGNRGATVYATVDLDDDLEGARGIDEFVSEPVNATLPAVREPGMVIQYATINLRDQIRKDDKTPLQFKYEAADCRIYYTLANAYNMTRLWRDVASIFKDNSICVNGSTGFSTTNNTTPLPPPKRQAEQPVLDMSNTVVAEAQFDDDPDSGLRAATGGDLKSPYACPFGTKVGQRCPNSKSICKEVPITCPEGSKRLPVCIPDCICQASTCNCDGKCQVFDKLERKVSGVQSVTIAKAGNRGQCLPKVGTGNVRLGCKANPRTPPF